MWILISDDESLKWAGYVSTQNITDFFTTVLLELEYVSL